MKTHEAISSGCKPTQLQAPFVYGLSWPGSLTFSPRLHSSIRTVFLVVVMVACAGCQTFSLSEEDFQKQQLGKSVDPKIGDLVGAVGTLGYYGAGIGMGVAAALGK